jgi:hypothetical protein
MKRFAVLAVLLVSAAACGGAPAEPASAPAAGMPFGSLEAPPVHSLIGHRQALELTSEQITVLDSIGQHVNAANRPLMQQMGELRAQFRGRTGRDMRTGEVVPGGEEGRSLLEQIRQNNRDAVEGVREVLTPAQQQRACALYRDADQRRQRAAAARAQQPGGAARARGATERPAVATVWPWCAEPGTPGAPAATPGS